MSVLVYRFKYRYVITKFYVKAIFDNLIKSFVKFSRQCNACESGNYAEAPPSGYPLRSFCLAVS